MSRPVHICTIQPPAVGDDVSHEQMEDTALRLLEEAGACDADLVCLPEYLNVMGCADDAWRSPGPAEQSPLFDKVAALARLHTMHVILPVLDEREDGNFNTSLVIDRSGQVVGRYDKTHLTAVEREDQGVQMGATYPVFDLDFGRIGIMTCYDGHFPEVARLLSLAEAEIILFPSLQRRITAEQLELQIRCRAIDNCVWIVRSSYGHADDVAWVPGMTAGKSCIVDFEATVLADAGPRVGFASHTVDLDRPRTKERSFGGTIGDARDFLHADRRPSTYGGLTDGA
ncbi:MAG: hypothetical protein CME05_03780 [Gemmatimonadaceae bacterium]|nr:hypothetical protein [Gemmatimonadaceae bacterium]